MEGHFCHGIKKLKSNCDFFFSSHNSVQTAPIDTDWATGLIHRAKRSLLWRWNTLKPVGSGCRDHYECGTN
uniref:Liver-expressed antimicrobial peptide 2 n=1 Tax=Sinocyclocheilus rhinocerous TaxID=307959 RepID=A0A673FPM9_9TELE